MTLQTYSSLKKTNVNLADLYSLKKQINIHCGKHVFWVVLGKKSYLSNKILLDCKISSLAANHYSRTKKGMNFEKYNSLQSLQSAIKRNLNKYFNTEHISYSISNDICNI